MLSYKNWTTEETNKLINYVNENKYSYVQIGKFLNRSQQSCQGKASFLKLKNNFLRRKCNLNDNFWAEINPLTCYWAGFVAADGYIFQNSNVGSLFKLELSNKDIEHLKKFCTDTEYDGRIINYSNRPTSYVSISSRQWPIDLEKNFNIIQNKHTRIRPINIKNDYLELCWLIGYIDGDGCIHYNKINHNVQINIVSACKDILEYINCLVNKFFIKIRNTSRSIKTFRDQYYMLAITGSQAYDIIHTLKDFPVPKLDRKWRDPIILNKTAEVIQQYSLYI